MKTLSAFWWSPRHSPRIAFSQRGSLPMWARLSVESRSWPRNFGDDLSPLVLSHLTNRKVSWAPPSQADVCAVGSILELYLSRGGSGLVWGSGLRSAKFDDHAFSNCSNVKFLAVRGLSTLSRVKPEESNVKIGDPGLFVNELFSKHVVSTKFRRSSVFVPHFSMWGSRASRTSLRMVSADHSIVSPTQSPLRLYQHVSNSNLIFSSSLHGIVLGHALNIPVVRVISDSTTESDWKYLDYQSGYSVSIPTISLEDMCHPKKVKIIREIASDLSPLFHEQAELIRSNLRESLLKELNN